LLESFLDYVDAHQGQLIILGDLFELFRYPLDRIICRRQGLLDRLARMKTIYVPGNHDEEITHVLDTGACLHPFFDRTSHAFVRSIGDRRFKFVHGHEVDPLINAPVQNIGRMLGSFSYFLEYRHGTCLLSNDMVTHALLEVGERLLALGGWLRSGLESTWRRCRGVIPEEKITLLAREIRTHRMLGRYDADRTEGLYDIAIVGHTHKAGKFSDWYFNSGLWTGPTNNFLRITPDGRIDVFDWGRQGPRPNETVVAARGPHRFTEHGRARRSYG